MNYEQLVKKCQKNIWLMIGGVDFEDDPFMELDYDYCFTHEDTLEGLKSFFLHGNWAIRQGVIYQNLCFINQVNGGDEWWTLKEFDGELVDFESITFKRIIEGGEFEEYIGRLLSATKEQCNNLTY